MLNGGRFGGTGLLCIVDGEFKNRCRLDSFNMKWGTLIVIGKRYWTGN